MHELLSRLNIWKKLAILLATFTVPLALLGWLTLSQLQSQAQFEHDQLIGLELLHPMMALSAQRPWALAPEKVSEAALPLIETAHQALRKHDSVLQGWADHFGESRVSISEMPTQVAHVASATSEELRDEVRATLDHHTIMTIRNISVQSGLLLDPEFDTYNMVFADTWLIPRQLILLRELGHSIDGSDTSLAEDVAGTNVAIRQLVALISPTEIATAVKGALNYQGRNSKSSGNLESSLDSYLSASKGLLALNNTHDATPSGRISLLAAVTMAEDELKKLSRTLQTEIKTSIVTRQSGHRFLLWTAAITSISALALLCFLAYSITCNITRPIYRLVQAFKAATAFGDLNQKVPSVGLDELSQLTSGFNQMTANLKEIVGGVKHSTAMVGGSTEEIAATSRQQQATANEVAATVVQVEATSKEISATSHQLAKTMTEVNEVAEATANAAASSQAGLVKMEETMERIVGECATIANRLSTLSERATKIGSIVTTISKVADQSNLLSLNAAIEAEKAGEAGRGFAVVASEIRRMADQTAVSSFDIEQTVKEMQSAVSASVMGMERFSDEVRRGVTDVKTVGSELIGIIGQVRNLTPRFESVHEGMGSQALGAQQISEAISQLSSAAQQSVQALAQSGKCVERLREASLSLETGIQKFSVEEGKNVNA